MPIGQKYAEAAGVPDLPIIEVQDSIGHDAPEVVNETAGRVVRQLLAIVERFGETGVRVVASEGEVIDAIDVAASGDLGTTVSEAFLARDWTDGLPVVPPTETRVQAMLEAARLPADEVLGVLPPRRGIATAGKVAVCAVMSGCEPRQFRIVVGAVRAMADPAFNLYSVQSTAHPLSPLVIVGGAAADEAGLSYGTDLTPRGWKANLAIARAVRLVQINMAGLPGMVASHTQGFLGRHVDCIRENDRDNPWEPYRVDRGFPADASTVTVFPAEPAHLVDDRGSVSPQSLLTTFATVIAAPGNRSVWGAAHQLVLVAPEHAKYLGTEGFSRQDVVDFLYEVARVPLHALPKGNLESLGAWRKKLFSHVDDHVTMPAVKERRDFHVMVHGGVGPHSMYVPGCLVAKPVTVVI